jgi:hypothetical protein
MNKKYVVDIAPGYAPTNTGSLTDGQHGCTLEAENMAGAVAAVKNRAAKEGWPKGEAMITELNRMGQRIEGQFLTSASRITIR